MFKLLWNPAKNQELKLNPGRKVCFEDIAAAIESGGLLADIEHPNKEKYSHQRYLAVVHEGYVYGVPCVQMENGDLFLKTAYPSRKLTKAYLTGESNDR